MRTNSRPVALAIDMPSEVLPTPGGPTSSTGPFSLSVRDWTARILDDALFDLPKAIVLLVQDLLRLDQVLLDLALDAPGDR